MMNVLTDMMCDTSLMAPQNYKETLSQNRIITQSVAAKSLHIISSVPQMTTVERQVNHSTLDMYNPNHIQTTPSLHSGFEESGDVSVFSDSFPEIVPSWLTHDFMKASESLSSPNILSNVPDIYQSRENEHLEMLDLGFSPELSSQDVVSNDLNQSCITQSQVELPMQRFQNNESLLMPSFDEMNITDLNSMQYQKFKQNVHLSKPPSIVNSVLPNEHLLHLPLHSNLSEQCLTNRSSPMLITSSQSQLNPVNVICDKVPQLNLNNLQSLLGSDNTLSEIQLLPQNFSNVGIDEDVTCTQSNQSCLTGYNVNTCDPASFLNPNSTTLPIMQDVSIQVSESVGNASFLQDQQCISCCQTDPKSAIDIVQCFKCRFCDFISLHKCAISSHINSLHSNPQDVFSSNKNDTPPTVTSPISSMKGDESLLSNSSSVNSTVILLVQSVVNKDMPASIANILPEADKKKCPKCDKIFAIDNDLKSHLLSHQSLSENNNQLNCQNSNMIQNISDFFRCVKCNKVFEKASYMLHLASEHNSDPKPSFLTDSTISVNYSNLLNSSVAENQFKSSSINSNPRILPKKTDSPQPQFKLKPIRKKTDSPKKSKQNAKEAVVTSSEKTFSAHKKAWKNKMKRELGSYICEFKGCNVRYRALDNLEYHRKCHASNGNLFVCPECGESHERWANIAGHLWRNHKIDMELHACDQCPFKTFRLSRLENIHKRLHKDECSFLCDFCGKGFKNGKQMRSHRVIHHKQGHAEKKKRQRVFKCNICEVTFPTKVILHHHQDVMHNLEQKSYLCNYCDYKAFKKSTLDLHMRQHTGEKPFKCDVCEYRTSDHNSLRRHKIRHTGEKPYKCPYCPYSSIQAHAYKVHLKKHPGHNGILFSCNICSFRTVKLATYEQHMKDHESLNILQSVNSLNEVSLAEEIFPIAEAMNISLSRSDYLIPQLNKHNRM